MALTLLACSLALMPAVIITGMVVNLVANNIIETRERARQWPLDRARGKR